MELNSCLIRGAEPVDSSSLNRCFSNLFTYLDGVNTSMLGSSSHNIPAYPFFKDGYNHYPIYPEAPTESAETHPDLIAYEILASSNSEYGLVERTYNGPLAIPYYLADATVTETPYGAYSYTESYVSERFVPTVSALYGGYYPLILGAILGDESAVEYANGTCSIATAYLPTVKYTSYLLCAGIGVSFGTITFNKEQGESQRNMMCVDVINDLIHINSVSRVLFVNVGNGFTHGIAEISEDLDMVEKMCSAKVTYLNARHTKIAITDITKNDASETIRIDRKTGCILEDSDDAAYGTYIEIPNDEYSLNFIVLFEYYLPDVSFVNSSVSLGSSERKDYSDFMRGVLLLNDEPMTLERLKIIDTSVGENRRNVVTNVSNAFNGCTNALFYSVAEFSNKLVDANGCFEGCINADFRSLTQISLASVSNVSRMFAGCVNSSFSALNTINIPNVSNASQMFYGCANGVFDGLTTITVGGNADSMFANCKSATFGPLENITGSFRSCNSMFSDCVNATFGTLKYIGSDTSKSVTMTKMFYGDYSATFASLYGILGTSNRCDSMFDGCTNASFETLTSIGTPSNTERMFAGCSKAKFDGLSSLCMVESGTASLLTNSNDMFNGCKSANITIQNFNIDDEKYDGGVNSITNADRMFMGCDSVTLCGDNTLSSLKFADSICSGCGTVNMSSFGYNVINAVSAFSNVGSCRIDNFILGGTNGHSITVNDCSYMFCGNGNASLDGLDWTRLFANTAVMNSMFRDCTIDATEPPSETRLKSTILTDAVSALCNSKGVSFNSVTSVDFGDVATLNCNSMFRSFNKDTQSLTGLSSIKLQSSSLIDTEHMFSSTYGLPNLTSVGLSSASVNADSMFRGTSGLGGLSSITIAANTADVESMFESASGICGDIVFSTLKPNSTTPSNGNCASLFKNAKFKGSGVIKPTQLYLPRSTSDATAYRGIFSGINYAKIKLGELTLSNTNIAYLSKNGTATDGSVLFSGINGWDYPSVDSASAMVGLKYEIASKMTWSYKNPWTDCYKILTGQTLINSSDIGSTSQPPVTKNNVVTLSNSSDTITLYFNGNGSTLRLNVSLNGSGERGMDISCVIYEWSGSSWTQKGSGSQNMCYYTYNTVNSINTYYAKQVMNDGHTVSNTGGTLLSFNTTDGTRYKMVIITGRYSDNRKTLLGSASVTRA